jgi:aspartate aminotransferase-like enzyme
METVAAAISPTTDLVTMVHNETSTGILNPASGVGRLAAEADARFVLDGVTSIGGDVVCIDDWHVDIAITDAQKALGAPPGISAVYVTDAVTDALDGERGPFYADLPRHSRRSRARSRCTARSQRRPPRSARRGCHGGSPAIASRPRRSVRGSRRWAWSCSPLSAT